MAFLYGADAVYCGTPKFAMRSRVGFTEKDLKEGIEYAHSIGKKVFVTINAFPHPGDIEELKIHIKETIKLNPDALIIADPGLVAFVKDIFDIPIHLSTQANTTNQLTAQFWADQGVERIVLARELSLDEIKIIKNNLTIQQFNNLQLEAFVHGAMCMAYSGRCQISNYLTGRDPNKGECIQACRFKYKLYGLEEDYRQGEIFPVYEDEEGSHILNSRDLCMIEYIPELISAGISSFKIEGRLKTEYYVATVTRAYRKAIDSYFTNESTYREKQEELKSEVEKTSNRGFTTGFYLNKPDKASNNYEKSKATSEWGYIGRVIGYNKATKMSRVEVKNYFPSNSSAEIITPDKVISLSEVSLRTESGEIEVAHAGNIVNIPTPCVAKDSLIRIMNPAQTGKVA
ncbi:MAG TPA: U32 family peptidase C-terminal domain-containing protein [bacterium]|nr:U32 family peptidase C-terminal domain-containing protein [bacterium]